MNEQPTYKSLKVTYQTWQALTRLSSMTGEPRTRLLERLIKDALITTQHDTQEGNKTMNIREGSIATHLQALGPQDVKVLTVNRAMNTAVIQFRELDQPASEKNTYTVTLDTLRAK